MRNELEVFAQRASTRELGTDVARDALQRRCDEGFARAEASVDARLVDVRGASYPINARAVDAMLRDLFEGTLDEGGFNRPAASATCVPPGLFLWRRHSPQRRTYFQHAARVLTLQLALQYSWPVSKRQFDGPGPAEQGRLAHALGLSPDQALAAWQAARTVAHADGPPGERSLHLLDVSAHALGVTPGQLQEIDLASVFASPALRRTVVDALVIPACIEGKVSVARECAVLGIAKALGVRSHWAELLPALRKQRALAVKRALASRSPDARRIFRRIWQEEGVLGVVRAVVFVLGLHRDAALAARFHALADCPEGSFGRAVTDHFHARGITFPGEKNGMPERMVHHDLMHVLNGYDTDPAGECELAAFYAAFADGDAFTFFVIVLATFHLGLRVSPSVVKPARFAFDVEKAVAAFVRGRSLRVDVMGAWDYWELMPLPIAQAEARLGLNPRYVPGRESFRA